MKCIAAEKFPQLKSRLENALQKQDPDEISATLKAIDKKIPLEILTAPDKELITKAEEKLTQIEAPKRNSFYLK